MEMTYIAALLGCVVDRMLTDRHGERRMSGDGGYTMETVLITATVVLLAIAAGGVIAVKVMNRAHGIDGGDTPPPITVPS